MSLHCSVYRLCEVLLRPEGPTARNYCFSGDENQIFCLGLWAQTLTTQLPKRPLYLDLTQALDFSAAFSNIVTLLKAWACLMSWRRKRGVFTFLLHLSLSGPKKPTWDDGLRVRVVTDIAPTPMIAMAGHGRLLH